MSFLNLLSKELNGKYDYLKVLKVVYNTTFSLCHINFIYPESVSILSQIQKDEIKQACMKVLNLKGKIDCKFNKSYLDENIVKSKVKEFMLTDFNSISACLSMDMINYQRDSFCISLTFRVNQTVRQYFVDNFVCEKLKAFLNDNFCGDFQVFVEVDNSQILDEQQLEQRALEAQNNIEVKTRIPRYKVGNLLPVFGGEIMPMPEFIKNVEGEKSAVILSGVVSDIEQKEYLPRRNKNKGLDEKRKMYKFKLTDESGSINAVHFCNKTSEKHFGLVEEGSMIVCLGDCSVRGNDKQYVIKAISLCSKAEEEEEEEREKTKEERNTYKYVKPTPYVRIIQDNLFDIKQDYPDWIMNNTFVVFDVETTGLVPDKNEITEIGAVKIVNGEITERFQTLCKPHCNISAEITKITGITNEMVENEHAPEEIIEDFLLFCGDSIMVGYNVNFDYQFIQFTAKKVDKTFNNEFRDCMGDAKSKLFLPNYKLGTVVAHLGITLNNAHRALFDATATAEAFLRLSLM